MVPGSLPGARFGPRLPAVNSPVLSLAALELQVSPSPPPEQLSSLLYKTVAGSMHSSAASLQLWCSSALWPQWRQLFQWAHVFSEDFQVLRVALHLVARCC